MEISLTLFVFLTLLGFFVLNDFEKLKITVK